MKITITCTCAASFEIKNGSIHPKEICCPNCGEPLPDNATEDILTALQSLDIFESKLAKASNHYGISYSD